jgi:tetratricopeptide (TPR) repeat protein
MQQGRDAILQALRQVEDRIAEGDRSADALGLRADCLAQLGRVDEARQQHLETLQQHPDHFATLINFGALLYETDFRTAARSVFERAVRRYPEEPVAHVNLANALMYMDEPELARLHCRLALDFDPGNLAAHQRLSELWREAGDMEAARHHHRLGFANAPPRLLPHLGDGEPIRLLLLTSTPGADVGWRRLVDRRRFAITEITAEFFDPAAALPAHDVVFNAIGDADLAPEAIAAAERLLACAKAPVVNLPAKVAPTGRLETARRLADIPGVVAPRMARLARATLAGPDGPAALKANGFHTYPLLLRSPGFHTGRHFVRVETVEALAKAAGELPGEEVLAIQHLDATDPDGFARKYRVMLIGGELYPLHLAVSADWKVHYFTGAMSGHAGFQAEEARFLDDMPAALGPCAMAALRAIQSRLGLDYGGVDFALDTDGRLLLFEANAVMTIVPPDASPQWDYRRPAIRRAMEAAQAMLIAKSKTAVEPAR